MALLAGEGCRTFSGSWLCLDSLTFCLPCSVGARVVALACRGYCLGGWGLAENTGRGTCCQVASGLSELSRNT